MGYGLARGMAQLVDCLPSKHEALSSKPQDSKKKKERKEKLWGCGD
jgi:hypothetical protein